MLAKNLPFEHPPKLEKANFAIPIFAACRGENRSLSHLLIEALKIALRKGSKTLEIEHASEAYDLLYNYNKENGSEVLTNPFAVPLDQVLISEVVKPTRYNANAMNPDDRIILREFSEPKTLAQLLSR